jgi:hypothetical protein
VVFVVSNIEEVLRASGPALLLITSPSKSLHAGGGIVARVLVWGKAKHKPAWAKARPTFFVGVRVRGYVPVRASAGPLFPVAWPKGVLLGGDNPAQGDRRMLVVRVKPRRLLRTMLPKRAEVPNPRSKLSACVHEVDGAFTRRLPPLRPSGGCRIARLRGPPPPQKKKSTAVSYAGLRSAPS